MTLTASPKRQCPTKAILIVPALFLFILPLDLYAATLNVPTLQYPTIQSAINAAQKGDVVVVGPYTFAERIQFKGKDIVVRSTNPSDPTVVANTVIDGSNGGIVVLFNGTEPPSAALEGLTIRRGTASGGLGGGIEGQGTMAALRHNTIRENSGTTGGGVRSVAGLIEYNIIEENSTTASSGAGLWNCNGTIRHNTIRKNRVLGIAYDGGGIGFSQGIIEHNLIEENESAGQGGGIGGSAAVIRFNVIRGNSAAREGGGVYGGTLSSNSSAVITNNIIINNFSGESGGGVFQASSSADLPVMNNVLYNNASAAEGGGARIGSSTGFYHNIVWGNSAPASPQLRSSSQPAYSLIQNWPAESGVGIVTSDPLFVNVSEGNFRLQAASPAVDAGNPIPLYNDGCIPPGLGEERADIGAYGGPENCGWPTPSPTPTPTPIPGSGPPIGGQLGIVLAAQLVTPFIDPDGGTVYLTFTWSSDGDDETVVQGPTEEPLAVLSESDGVTFDAGEKWTVSVVATDDQGQTSNSKEAYFLIGQDGSVTFSGWVLQ